MSLKSRQALAIATACILVVGVMAAAGFTVWRDLGPEERAILEPILNPRLGLLIMIGLVGVGAAAVTMKAFAQAGIGGPALLADEIGLIVGTDPARRVKPSGSPELKRIAEAVNTLADQRRSLQEDVEARIHEARLSVEEERNRLAALMSELNQSVVVCNLDGRILLYNSRARLQFRALSDAPTAAGGGEIIGLGRSIYAVFERNLIVHALESIQERLRRQSAQPVANFVTTTRAGQLLSRLFPDDELHAAVQRDRVTGVYADPARVHTVTHAGQHWFVDGVHLAEPSPQRTPASAPPARICSPQVRPSNTRRVPMRPRLPIVSKVLTMIEGCSFCGSLSRFRSATIGVV